MTAEQFIINNKNIAFYKLKRDLMIKLLLTSSPYLCREFVERTLNIKTSSIKVKDKNNYTLNSINEDYILKLLDKELKNNTVFSKSKIVDLLIETDDSIIDLEVNSVFGKEEKERNVRYLNNLDSNNIFIGEKYKKKKKSVQINLCWDLGEFDWDRYVIRGDRHKNSLVDSYEIYVFNIDFFKNKYYNCSNKKLINKYAHLIMLDCDLDELKRLKEIVGDEFMEQVYNSAERYGNNKNIFKYMSLEDDFKYMNNIKLAIAREEGIELGMERGIEKGIEKGMERGMEKGIEKGMECGIEKGEQKNKIETAQNMLKENLPIDMISRVTNLTTDYIMGLNINK